LVCVLYIYSLKTLVKIIASNLVGKHPDMYPCACVLAIAGSLNTAAEYVIGFIPVGKDLYSLLIVVLASGLK